MEHISEFWQGIGTVLGALGGLSAFVMFLLMFKQNKRIKTNDADRGEIKKFREIIDGLSQEVDRLRASDSEKSKQILSLKASIKKLELDYDVRSEEISIYKKAMSFVCTRKNCPKEAEYARLKAEAK